MFSLVTILISKVFSIRLQDVVILKYEAEIQVFKVLIRKIDSLHMTSHWHLEDNIFV